MFRRDDRRAKGLMVELSETDVRVAAEGKKNPKFRKTAATGVTALRMRMGECNPAFVRMHLVLTLVKPA